MPPKPAGTLVQSILDESRKDQAAGLWTCYGAPWQLTPAHLRLRVTVSLHRVPNKRRFAEKKNFLCCKLAPVQDSPTKGVVG